MIAVTVGVGPYADMARHAARQFSGMTGMAVRVLGDREFAASGLTRPHHLKFRILDVVDGPCDEDVLYFDGDMVCLNPWDPTALRDAGAPEAVVGVRDRMVHAVFEDAAALGVPAAEYINSGLFLLNRRRHLRWLREAEAIAAAGRRLPFVDQSALNAARVRLGIPLRPLDRRYNWVCFGEGTLEYQVPVFMAHRLLPADNGVNMDYFAGRYSPPLAPCVAIDLRATAALEGRAFTYLRPGGASGITLRAGGTVEPPAAPEAEGYWFVQAVRGRPVLTLASQTRLLYQFNPSPGGTWAGEDGPDCRKLRSRNSREAEAEAVLVGQRWFSYERVGHDRRPLELLGGGRIGLGRAACEEVWSVAEQSGGELSLALGGHGVETCCLTPDEEGSWRGRWLAHERMPVSLTPLRGPPQ